MARLSQREIKNETHVLWPHYADGHPCTGYEGDVDAWSAHNKKHRRGCAQIVQEEGASPVIIYEGNASGETLQTALKQL